MLDNIKAQLACLLSCFPSFLPSGLFSLYHYIEMGLYTIYISLNY